MTLELDKILTEPIGNLSKGFPPGLEATVGNVGELKLHALDGDFTFPLLVARRSALAWNANLMANYCAERGVRLAPHGKTHMSPQLWERQRALGAWAVTVATMWQARVFAEFGAERILIANEITNVDEVKWVQRQRGDREFVTVVDSAASLDVLLAGVAAEPHPQDLDVLVEFGYAGGRAGARDPSDVVRLARHLDDAPGVRFAGLEGFEGLMQGAPDEARARVEAYLGDARQLLGRLLRDRPSQDRPAIVSFGGSKYFDLVVAAFTGIDGAEVVLRSGCYLTHDHGDYLAFSPLSGPAGLRPALELWAQIVSVPEAGHAIAGFGRRDTSDDIGFPVPLRRRADGRDSELDGVRVTRMNDQHAFIAFDPSAALEVGDLLCFGISHPCTTFDRWKLIPEVDDDAYVVGALRTFF